ncbi:MAG TPA: hypothetical protein VH189_08225 [Rhizomicrobium sp.]|nr:hypothetical protein [Rhizomicrobium sp.]
MKRIVFSGLFLLSPAMAQADPRDEALSAMLRCSGMGDKGQRLACYDSAAVRVPGALRAPAPNAAAPSVTPIPPPIPSSVATASAAASPDVPAPVRHIRRSNGFLDKLFGPDGPKRAPQRTVAEFGSESIANGGVHAYPQPMDEDAIDAISARLANYDLSSGALIVSLDNGQVWRQVGGDPVGHLQFAAARYVATISRGGSGAYALKLSGMGHSLPVRRIR